MIIRIDNNINIWRTIDRPAGAANNNIIFYNRVRVRSCRDMKTIEILIIGGVWVYILHMVLQHM